jgi:hypothetical protein
LEFSQIPQLKDSEWEFEFYKEEIYRYRPYAIEPSPVYVIRALYYSNGSFLTLGKLENEEDFRDDPELLQALRFGAFDGHFGSIEDCMNDTILKINNAVNRALGIKEKKK